MIDYSKVMKPHTVYDWEIKQREEWEKKREQEEKEAAELAAKLEQEEKLKTEEFIKPFLKHPISDEIIEQLKTIKPVDRLRAHPVYIVDYFGEIIAMVKSKNLVGNWLYRNGYSKKPLGRTTVFEYIRNRTPYGGDLYIVPVDKYEEFIKENFADF